MASYFGWKNNSVRDSCFLVGFCMHTHKFIWMNIFTHNLFSYPDPWPFCLSFGGKIPFLKNIFDGIHQVFGVDMSYFPYFLSNEILPFVVGNLVLYQMRYAKSNMNWNANVMTRVFVSCVIYFWKPKCSAMTYFTICELYLLLIWLKQLEMEIVRAI